jgi:hypothetical protein
MACRTPMGWTQVWFVGVLLCAGAAQQRTLPLQHSQSTPAARSGSHFPALVSRAAESDEREIEDHVTTGMLKGDSPFAPHGHPLRLRIGGSQIIEILNTMTCNADRPGNA